MRLIIGGKKMSKTIQSRNLFLKGSLGTFFAMTHIRVVKLGVPVSGLLEFSLNTCDYEPISKEDK